MGCLQFFNHWKKTIVQQLPILNDSPTCWENLYWAMKDSEKVNKELSSNGSKTYIIWLAVICKSYSFGSNVRYSWQSFFSNWRAICCIYLVKSSWQAYRWKRVRPCSVLFHLPDVTNQTNWMVIQSLHAGSSFDHPMSLSWKHFEHLAKISPHLFLMGLRTL